MTTGEHRASMDAAAATAGSSQAAVTTVDPRMLTGDTRVVVFDMTAPCSSAEIAAVLERDGVVVLRDLLPRQIADELVSRVKQLMLKPAIAGTIGYSKVDFPKKIANAFLVGRPMVELTTDLRVIDAIETYMGSDCVLAEAFLKQDEPVGYEYFPMHSDFAIGWRKSATAKVTLSAADMKYPVGVGGVFYLHETHSGAFSYCIGTHKLMSPRGQNLDKYPEDERRRILEARVRIDGRTGDLILFDDRGFHGPDQPALAQRTVVLLDYYRVQTFGHAQVAPIMVYTKDLGGLGARQLSVLGVGAEPMVAAEEYVGTNFRRNRFFSFFHAAVDKAYIDVHIRQKIKRALGIRRGDQAGQI